MTALGMIETKGLIGAIEAADAMLKAASVHLLEKQLATGGLVTITIAGEVAAVRAALDAASVAISRIGGAVLVSKHVIARPDKELERVIRLLPPKEELPKGKVVSSKEVALLEESLFLKDQTNSKDSLPLKEATISKEASFKVHEVVTPQPAIKFGEAELKKMNADKLRKVAQGITGISMSKKEIAKADKNVLLKAILHVYKQRADEE